VLDAKVKVVFVGWPVEVNVPLKVLLPPKVNVVPDGKVAQDAVQVTVAVDPLPDTLLTIPPTNAVSV
jgi:hypothetical protein